MVRAERPDMSCVSSETHMVKRALCTARTLRQNSLDGLYLIV